MRERNVGICHFEGPWLRRGEPSVGVTFKGLGFSRRRTWVVAKEEDCSKTGSDVGPRSKYGGRMKKSSLSTAWCVACSPVSVSLRGAYITAALNFLRGRPLIGLS